MSQCFVLVGGNDRKILLENTTHPCPRCKRDGTVQLTRFENELILFNKHFDLPNHMQVRYACRVCHWKNENLPDDDPFFQCIPKDSDLCPSKHQDEYTSDIFFSDLCKVNTSSTYQLTKSMSTLSLWKQKASSLCKKDSFATS